MIKMKYKVSVIIPIYNSEKYLESTINSVINQTIGFKNIELYDLNDSDPVSKKPDTVTSVTINGDTSYEDNSFFPPDVIITIAHH